MVLCLLAFVLVASAGEYSLYEPVKLVARPDYTLGLVFIEKWRGDYYLGVDRVLTLDEYLGYQLGQAMTESWQEKARRTAEQKDLVADATGLIPDISLPKLPIFGEGSKIDISGRDRITLGGRTTRVFVPGVRDTSRSFPELKMNQELAVSLKGTIGERMKVNIDFDDQRLDGKNKVSLSYTGTEDEVLQSLELGDTRLSIPGSAYTGDLPAFKGLFGASARGKLAGVDVYAIASREESQNQTQTFTGQRRVSVDTIFNVEYVPRRFYRIPVTGTIRTLRVYLDDNNIGNNQAAVKGIATVRPDSAGWVPDSSGWTYDRASGEFDLKSYGSDYFLRTGNVLEFAYPLNTRDVVGLVVYTDTDSIGGDYWPGPGDSLVLLLLKPQVTDTLSLTWDYELRNAYQLPSTEVTLDTLWIFRDNVEGVDPDYESDGTNRGTRFTQILGLDPNGDNRVEYPEFEKKTGLIFFPDEKPFASTGLSVRDSVIYRRDPYELSPGEGRKYYMVAKFYSATETYSLGQPDITEGSEKVMVNSELWVKDDGYSIDYRTGIVKFLKPLPANADIRITYEYRPLFSISQKSLLGTRAELNMSQRGKIGTSLFYRSEGTGDDKPALGNEPFRRMIAEADASYTASSNAVTAFLDRLPLLRAQAPTTFSAGAEGAVSLPDPNTRGAAYLDDFEGTTLTREVLNTALLWSWSSVPAEKDTDNFARTPLFWHNPAVRVNADSVFGTTGREGRDETRDVLRVVFTPDSGDSGSWAGIMTSPSPQLGMNLKDFNELKVVLKSRHGRGRLHFSAGLSIDEDAPRRTRGGRIVGYDGILNTEDRDGNGQLNDGVDDTGLDGVFGADSLWGADSLDDGNDDYDPVRNPMGTERNGRLDGEDLDRSGFSRYNHYFECAIDLDDEAYSTPLRNDWRLIRLPLMDSTVFRTVGRPKWEDIRLVRVWFDEFETRDTVDFYSIEFTGSRWTSPRLSMVRDTNFVPVDTAEKVWVTQVSLETDTSYRSPFKLKTDAQGQTENEAALLLGYSNLRGNRRATISKTITEREDYRDYSRMRIYVHDDGNGLSFLLRIGSDSANYYQYRARITDGLLVPGSDGKWYEFVIPLDTFPALKGRGGSGGTTEGAYSALGVPSLADVRYTVLGIEHPGWEKLTGGIWFNDIRLMSPRREPGYGFQARTNLALSDFISAGLTFGYSDPNFRRFSEGRGVKVGGFGTNLGFNTRANIDRLLPYSWGLSLPLSYSLSQQEEMPKFDPIYPDRRLTRTGSGEYLSNGRAENISLDNVRKNRSGNRWLNYSIEAMAASWRMNRGRRHTALSDDSTSSNTIQWSYSVSPDLKVNMGRETELYWFPQNIRFGLSDARRRDWRSSRIHPDSTPRVDVTRGHGLGTDMGLEYSPLDDLTFDYSYDTERDLLAPDEPFLGLQSLKLGSEVGQEHSFNAGYNIDIGDILSPSLDFNGDYTDDRPRTAVEYDSSRNMNNSGEIEVSLGIDLPEILGQFEAKPAGPAPRPKPVKPDTTRKDSIDEKPPEPEPPKPEPPRFRPRLNIGALSRVLDAIDASYSVSRSSDVIAARRAAPWLYRLGFIDEFPLGSEEFVSSSREHNKTLRLSSGARVGELSGQLSYDWSEGRDYSSILTSVVFDRSTTFPSLSLTLGKVHNLFKKYATDSRLTASYRSRYTLSGQLVPDDSGVLKLSNFGKSESRSNELSPLVSWTTTWKKRITTTLSSNYTWSNALGYQNDEGTNWSQTDARDIGGNLSLSYTFSAPQGLKVPFLKKLKFSSDLSLTGTLRLSQTMRTATPYIDSRAVEEQRNVLQKDNSFGFTVAASYRFSRSIEAGLNTGLNRSRNLTGTTTQSVDLDFWVLFKF